MLWLSTSRLNYYSLELILALKNVMNLCMPCKNTDSIHNSKI